MTTYAIGTLRFQKGSRLVTRNGEAAARLSHSEYSFRLTLCETGIYRADEGKRIDNSIYRLRGKLGLDAEIICDWKNGYRLLNAVPVLL